MTDTTMIIRNVDIEIDENSHIIGIYCDRLLTDEEVSWVESALSNDMEACTLTQDREA